MPSSARPAERDRPRRLEGRQRPPGATVEVAVVVGLLAVFLLQLSGRYGPHRDELYFVAAGHHLAWGYPDQPALTPLIARLASEVAPHSLLVLRLSSVVAVCALVWMSAAFSRLLGGGRPAQVLTAVVVAVCRHHAAAGPPPEHRHP